MATNHEFTTAVNPTMPIEMSQKDFLAIVSAIKKNKKRQQTARHTMESWLKDEMRRMVREGFMSETDCAGAIAELGTLTYPELSKMYGAWRAE